MDDATAWKVVLENVGLVKKATDRFCRSYSGRIFEDLYPEALMGAHRAAKKFDPNRGRLPAQLWWGAWNGLTHAWQKDQRQLGILRKPVGEDGKRTLEYDQKVYLTDPRRSSWKRPGGQGEHEQDEDWFERTQAEESFEDDLISRLSAETEVEPYLDEISTWPERNQDIFFQRILEERTLADIAADYGLTRERINQIVKEGLAKLRKLGDGTAASPLEEGATPDSPAAGPATFSEAAAPSSSPVEAVA